MRIADYFFSDIILSFNVLMWSQILFRKMEVVTSLSGVTNLHLLITQSSKTTLLQTFQSLNFHVHVVPVLALFSRQKQGTILASNSIVVQVRYKKQTGEMFHYFIYSCHLLHNCISFIVLKCLKILGIYIWLFNPFVLVGISFATYQIDLGAKYLEGLVISPNPFLSSVLRTLVVAVCS